MREQATYCYKFGPFVLDIDELRLSCDGKPLPLPPKVFNTLSVLVRNNGHILSKDELMKAVWPDSFVEEANLSQSIFTLRKVLGENANGEQYIETIPKRGYRFTSAVEEVQEELLQQEVEVALAQVSESPFRLSAAKRSVLALSVLIIIGLSGFYFLKPSAIATRSLAV